MSAPLPEAPLTDRFARVHDYLRISLTDACNLRCFYCMPGEVQPVTPAAHLMQKPEIAALAERFVAMGIKKIRLTGGEPLVRKDAGAILHALSSLGVLLTLTTNATRIEAFIDRLHAAGVGSLNVSLDSLRPERFAAITKRDLFAKVRSNIDLLLREDFAVKINTVLARGVNDDEIDDFIEWTRELPIEVRFIEFMPFSGNRWEGDKVVSLAEILSVAGQARNIQPLPAAPHDTAKCYRARGHVGSFAVISTMSAPFCGSCNRLRLTADGKLKNCLFSSGEADLLTPLRAGEDIGPLIRQAVMKKAFALGGQMALDAPGDFRAFDASAIANRSMIAIGG